MTFTVRLGAADAGRVRFATSPIWETVNAARTLVDPRSAAYHARWLERARPRAAELPLEPLFAVHPPHGYVPDFLSPPPESTSPSGYTMRYPCACEPSSMPTWMKVFSQCNSSGLPCCTPI